MIRRLSIKRKIIGIALILIALMTVTALISLALVMQVSGRLEELTQSYVPAYAALARANVHSLERAVALRRMVIEKIQSPPDEARYADARKRFEESGGTVDRETKAARDLLDGLIAKGSSFGDADGARSHRYPPCRPDRRHPRPAQRGNRASVAVA